jgi:hypothetical protein
LAEKYRRRTLDPTRSFADPDLITMLPQNPTDLTEFLANKVRHEPRQEEALVMARVETAIEGIVDTLFAEADAALEDFYGSVRVVVLEDRHGVEMPKKDDQGHFVWEVDEAGRPVEDWDKLDGMDVERAIMVLQRVINRATPDITKLETRMLFAQEAYEDEHATVWGKVGSGTIDDKKAAARRQTRDQRFYFFILWWVWRHSSERLRLLVETKKDLEYMRHRLIREIGYDAAGERQQRRGN